MLALLADGITVPLVELCDWFGVPRRRGQHKRLRAAPIKVMIEESPSFVCRIMAFCRPSTVRPRMQLLRVSRQPNTQTAGSITLSDPRPSRSRTT